MDCKPYGYALEYRICIPVEACKMLRFLLFWEGSLLWDIESVIFLEEN